ncbi:MAG: hypothetical protein EBZ77_01345, partial [Chitinophagia bacterium]|nr:hypothetical protein [Chitinophagia bacterium]
TPTTPATPATPTTPATPATPATQQTYPAAQQAQAGKWEGDKYCEGSVCVKHPNCFGANYGDDSKCSNCREAQRAYSARGWAWLGTQPDAALFCKTWP